MTRARGYKPTAAITSGTRNLHLTLNVTANRIYVTGGVMPCYLDDTTVEYLDYGASSWALAPPLVSARCADPYAFVIAVDKSEFHSNVVHLHRSSDDRLYLAGGSTVIVEYLDVNASAWGQLWSYLGADGHGGIECDSAFVDPGTSHPVEHTGRRWHDAFCIEHSIRWQLDSPTKRNPDGRIWHHWQCVRCVNLTAIHRNPCQRRRSACTTSPMGHCLYAKFLSV